MKDLKERTDKLFIKKGDDKTVESIVGLMKYFGWTFEDVRKLPMPTYYQLIETINKMEKDIQEKSKRKK